MICADFVIVLPFRLFDIFRFNDVTHWNGANNNVNRKYRKYVTSTGADPGFPVGGGASPPGGGRQHTNLPNLSKNCIKLRKFWSMGGGGHAPGAPLGSPLH